MKTKVEVLGYEIEIEEVDGVVTVKADLDGETVEEFTLESPEEGQGQEEGEDVKSFKDFDGQEEETDFEDSEDFESEEGEDTEEGEEENDDDKALESFQAFFEKKKR